MVRSHHDPPHRNPQHARNGKRRDEPLCGGHAQQRRRHCPRRMTVTGFVVMMGHGFLYSVTVRGCRWWRPGNRVMRKFRGNQIGFLGFCRLLPPLGARASPRRHKSGRDARAPREAEGVSWLGACAASVSADICSRCAPAGLPNRHTEPTSAAVNRRTSMRYGSLRTRCSRPTGCHDAACGGFSPRPARSPWWRGRTARSWASPSCCFVLTAGSRDSIPSQSPRNTQAAGLHRPCSRWQRRSRCGANADPCGLRSTKEITVPLRCIARPGIMSSAGTITTIRTAATRSGSRSNWRMTDHRTDGRRRGLESDICYQKGK